MPTVANDGRQKSETRLLGYSFGLLVLGVLWILVGVVVLGSVPATLGGALIAGGYLLVYVGFLLAFYLDLRSPTPVRVERPIDGESG